MLLAKPAGYLFIKGEHLQHTKEAKKQDAVYSCHGETLNNLADTKTSVFVVGMYRKNKSLLKLSLVNLWKISAKKFWQGLLTSPSFIVYDIIMCALIMNSLFILVHIFCIALLC